MQAQTPVGTVKMAEVLQGFDPIILKNVAATRVKAETGLRRYMLSTTPPSIIAFTESEKGCMFESWKVIEPQTLTSPV